MVTICGDDAAYFYFRETISVGKTVQEKTHLTSASFSGLSPLALSVHFSSYLFLGGAAGARNRLKGKVRENGNTLSVPFALTPLFCTCGRAQKKL